MWNLYPALSPFRTSPVEYWTGITKSGVDWEYPGSVTVTTDLPWAVGEPGVGDCATLAYDKPRLVGRGCTETHTVICQTQAQSMLILHDFTFLFIRHIQI